MPHTDSPTILPCTTWSMSASIPSPTPAAPPRCTRLWMGVPTLTLAGATCLAGSARRFSGHLGLDAFIAQTAPIRPKRRLAGQRAAAAGHLARQHAELLANSALGQPGVIADGLESALRAMWQRWCAGYAAGTFEIELIDCTGDERTAHDRHRRTTTPDLRHAAHLPPLEEFMPYLAADLGQQDADKWRPLPPAAGTGAVRLPGRQAHLRCSPTARWRW